MQEKENRREENITSEETLPQGERNYYTIKEETVYPTRGGSRYPVREETVYPVHGESRYPIREETVYPTRDGGRSHYPVREETVYPTHRGSGNTEENTISRRQREAKRKEESTTSFQNRERVLHKENHAMERGVKTTSQNRKETSTHSVSKSQSHRKADRDIHHKHKKKRKRGNPILKVVLFLVIALLLGWGCFRFVEGLMAPTTGTENLTGKTVEVTIPQGATTNDIADILKEKKLIRSKFSFRLSSKLNGYDGTYQQGKYDVDTGMEPTQIMELLQTGVVHNKNKITIPEGYNTRQIAAKAEELGICTAKEFIEESNEGVFEYEFLNDLPKREYRLEGYLFPDTYYLSDEMTAHDLIDAMLARFDQMYTAEYQQAVANSGHTLDEIVTIASMIEKEIKVDDERAKAAGVIYNRLKQNMSLGIDATVLYALGKTAGELTKADLQIDSPYNTRINKGLPLGPIANSGEASFRAALYPDTNDYLYYVVEAKGSDAHVFTKTYEEFLAAKEKYQKSRES